MTRLTKYAVLVAAVQLALLFLVRESVAQSSATQGGGLTRRAILASFDGFSEERFHQFADSAVTPALWKLFRNGACAEAARPAYPSITPSGHAAIWTGVYGNVNGIAGRGNAKFPLATSTILETTDGFSADALRAEPLWISAGRQGRSVFAHMVTQSPGPPGYPDPDTPALASAKLRREAVKVLARENVRVINGYNRLIADARILSGDSIRPGLAGHWKGLKRIGRTRSPLREFSWVAGQDSMHALIFATRSYSGMVVSGSRDVAHGVIVRPRPADTTSARGRVLARYFSDPLEIKVPRGRAYIYARLFELSPDLKRFTLFISEARAIEANRSELSASYDAAVAGMIGNGASKLLKRGALGPILAKGGNGDAEWRYLESLELLTRQFMRGSTWGWKTFKPALQLDYFPLPDEALHTWLGYADPATPLIPADVRRNAAAFLARSYILADLRLQALLRLAGDDPNTLLIVTGEHGMRPTWKRFRPNAVLRSAGLLALDRFGGIDLSRTVAAAPSPDWITVNRSSRRAGIVSPDSVARVISDVEATLFAARDSSGNPIVMRTWRPNTLADSLGIGGPAGGDLYIGVARGIAVSSDPKGVILEADIPQGEHGYPSIDLDMQPVLCGIGKGVAHRRFGKVRSIDAAPTVSAWLGIRPPVNSKGRSLLGEMGAADR